VVTVGNGLPANEPLDARLADAVERLGNALRHHDQHQAGPLGLTPLQLRLLRAAASLPAERRRTGALAAELEVTQPTVSDALRVLEGKGLVSRIADADDRRASLAAPTAAGRDLLARLDAPRALLAPTLERLTDEQKVATLETLLALIADLLAEDVITVARTCTTCRFFAQDLHADGAVPHHCRLLDRPLPRSELRTDCPEHQPV